MPIYKDGKDVTVRRQFECWVPPHLFQDYEGDLRHGRAGGWSVYPHDLVNHVWGAPISEILPVGAKIIQIDFYGYLETVGSSIEWYVLEGKVFIPLGETEVYSSGLKSGTGQKTAQYKPATPYTIKDDRTYCIQLRCTSNTNPNDALCSGVKITYELPS